MATNEDQIRAFGTLQEHLTTIERSLGMAEAHMKAVRAICKKLNRHFGQQKRQMHASRPA